MKTITLDEAFAKAMPGEIVLGLETEPDRAQLIAANGGHVAYVEYAPEVHNAILLAHCFNHMRELRDALQVAVNMLGPIVHKLPVKTHFSEKNTLENIIKKALDRANTVTLP